MNPETKTILTAIAIGAAAFGAGYYLYNKKPPQPTLYEQLGGEAAVDAAVDVFYKLVLADPMLAPFFAKTDMKKQLRMQKSFLNHVFGGKEYHGKSMRKAHAGMGLTDEHFNRVAMHLAEALTSLGVAKNLIDKVLAVVETTRSDVLGI